MSRNKRGDAWLESDDQILATVVISHITSGSTQLKAFEEVAIKLNRTASACGFRWNSALRKNYENQIKKAKLAKGKLQESHREREVFVSVSKFSQDQQPAVAAYDDSLKQIIKLAKDQLHKFDLIVEENARLKAEINQLKQLKLKDETDLNPQDLVKEDLQAFLQIMKRAKSLSSINANT